MKRLVSVAITLGGAALVTTVFLSTGLLLEPPSPIIRMLCFPVPLLLTLAGSGPTLGNGLHEWTPVHDLAVALGFGATWAFYSAACLLLLKRISTHLHSGQQQS